MSISDTNAKKDAAFRGVVEATQIFKEIYSPHDLRTLLEQELTRENVLADLAARRKPVDHVAAGAADAGSAVGSADADAWRIKEILGLSLKALSFYADSDSYERRGNKPSLIMADKGDVARDALQALDAFVKAGSAND